MAHPNQILFTEGVGHIFKLWQSLNIAVQNEWGGHESKEKRQWMMDVVIEEFGKRGKNLEVYDIEDILNQIMSDEFETILEDDSAFKVANDLFHLYKDILAGNPLRLQKLREATNRQTTLPPTTATANEPDSSDEEENSDSTPQNDEMA